MGKTIFKSNTLKNLANILADKINGNEEVKNEKDIQLPSDKTNKILLALCGLMGGIWGGKNVANNFINSNGDIDIKSIFGDKGISSFIGSFDEFNTLFGEFNKNMNNYFFKNTSKFENDIIKTLATINTKIGKTDNDNIVETINAGVSSIIQALPNNSLNTKSDNIKIEFIANDMNSLVSIFEKINDPAYDMQNFKDFVKCLNDLNNIGSLNKVKEDIEKFISTLDNFVKQIPEIINEEKISSALNINVEKTLKPLKDLFNSINDLNKNQTNIDLEPFINTLSLLKSELDLDDKTNNINLNIGKLNSIITGNKDSLHTLFENINKLIPDASKSYENVKNISIILDNIINLMTSDINPNNIFYVNQYITKLIDIFNPDNGPIKQLFENISKLTVDNGNKVSRSISNLSNLFSAISTIANISPLKMIGMKFNISFLETFMMRDILKIMKELKSIDDNKETKEVYESIKNLNSLFNTIASVGEIDSEKRNQMFINLKFIRMFMMNDITKLMEEIAKFGGGKYVIDPNDTEGKRQIFQGNNQQLNEAYIAISNISALFDSLTKLGEIDSKARNRINRNIKAIKNIVKKDITELITDISSIQIDDKSFEKIQEITLLVNNFISIFDSLPSFVKLVKSWLAISLITEIGLQYKTFINTISKIDIKDENVEIIEKLKKIFDILNSLEYSQKKSKEISKVINVITHSVLKLALIGKLAKYIEVAATVMDNVAEIIKNTIKKFSNFKRETIDKALDVLNGFCNIVIKSAAILIFASLISVMINPINLAIFTACLGLFVITTIGIYGWAFKHINDTLDSARGLALIIVTAGATLILGSLFMKLIDPGELILFGATLGGFIMGITGVLGLFGKNIKDSGDTLLNFAALVLVSGGVMMLGGLFMNIIDPGDLALFAITLGAFIFATTWAVAVASPLFTDALLGLRDFTVLVAVSGAVMVAAAMLGDKIDGGALFGFAFDLGLFIFATLMALAGAKKLGMLMLGGKDPFQESALALRDFAILVLASGAVMVAAAMLGDKIDGGALFKFALNLGLFVAMTTAAYALTSRFIEGAIDDAKQFGLLLLFSAAVMIFGGTFFTLFPGIIPGTFLFAAVLGGFMMAVGFGLMLASKFIENGQKTILEMTLLVVLSGALMLFAGWMMTKHPKLKENIFYFVGAEFLLIFGMAGVCLVLDKIKGNLIKGIFGLLLMTGVVLLSTYVLEKINDMNEKVQWGNLFEGLGKLAIALILLGAGYVAFGAAAAATWPFLVFAGVALLAIDGLTLLTIYTLDKISTNFSTKQDTKHIDNFKLALSSLKTIGDNIIETFTGLWILKLPFVAASVLSLSKIISLISTSVKDYSELKIPVYQGTKVVKYRELTNRDFINAGNNVSKIITVLGNAVISTYDKNKDIFDSDFKFLGLVPVGKSKFSKVAQSLMNLGPLLSKISKAVKEYSTMKIPIYEGTKIVGYRNFDDSDFKNASSNVKHIIETLGKAVIESYDENPEIYEEPTLFGKSKFSMVCKSLSKLGPMIANIAKGVKDYANMRVIDFTKGFEKDKFGLLQPREYKELKPKDFENAANNVKLILSTLGKAIIETYEENPDLYAESGGILGFGGSSPFTKTISANMKLANLISKIASSVKDYANMRVIDFTKGFEKDKFGLLQPKAYKELKPKDFENAANNVKLILSILGKAIIETYRENSDLYEESGGILGFGGSSPFTKTISANMKLANLISKIGKSVKEFANFTVGTKYEKDSKTGLLLPTEYKKLEEGDFRNAANNIKLIMTILGGTIIDLYNEHKADGMYDDPETWYGTKKSDSPFNRVLSANMKLANLISTIGKTVKDLASCSIPTAWDPKTGKPTSYEQLSSKHFIEASESIKQIITILGDTIISTYKSKSEWFEDGPESIFAMACTAIGTMGNMINNIAQGIQAYADLKIPVYKDGKITGYDKINEDTFKLASSTISTLITTLGSTIISTYKENKKWFDDGPESDFAMACAAIGSMGDMLGKVSTGLQSYAELKFPIKWDKDGNPVDFKVLKESDFTTASANIIAVIKVLGETILNFYNDHQEMFKFDINKNPDSPFAIVISGCSMMGDMIASISTSIQNYAELRIPTGFDKNGKPKGWKKVNNSIFIQAANNIKTIIEVIGKAIDTTFYQHKDWFNHKTLQKITEKEKTSIYSVDQNDPPFIAAITGCKLMGAMISDIAKGIQDFANLSIPLYDSKGKIIGRQKFDNNIFGTAKTNISDIISFFGNTIMNNKNHDPEKIKNMTKAYSSIGKMISSVAKGIQSYANLTIPTDWDPTTGNPIKFERMKNDQIQDAGTTIKTVLQTIIDAVTEESRYENFSDSNLKRIMNMMAAIQKTSSVLRTVAKTIKAYASMNFVEIDTTSNPTKPKYKVTHLGKTEITEASKSIGIVITSIGEAIIKTMSKPNAKNVFGKNINESPAYMIAMSMSKIATTLRSLAKTIYYYSKNEFPILTLKDGKLSETGKFKFEKNTISDANKTISEILCAIGNSFDTVYKKYPQFFNTEENNKSLVKKITNGITQMSQAISSISGEIKNLVEINMEESSDKLSKLTGLLENDLTHIGIMYALLTANMKAKSFRFTFNGKEYIQSFSNNISISEWFALKQSVISKFPTAISNISQAIISIYNSCKELPKAESFKSDNFIKLIQPLSDMLESLYTLVEKISKLDFASLKATGNESNLSLESLIISRTNLLKTTIQQIKSVINETTSLNNIESLAKLKSVLTDYSEIILKMYSLFDAEKQSNNFMPFMNTSSKQEIEQQIEFFGNNIEKIINLSKSSKEIGEEGLNNISSGISKVDQVMQNITGLDNFTKYNKEMTSYVTTLNSIKTDKVDKMTNLVNAISKLSSNVKGIDKLTNTISKHLSAVLDKLANEMHAAKEIIDKSDEMQNKRHEMIKKSAKELSDIMKQKLVVEISQVSDDELLPGDGKYFENNGDDGKSKDNTSNENTGDKTNSNTPSLNTSWGNNENSNESKQSNMNNSKQNKTKQEKQSEIRQQSSMNIRELINELKITLSSGIPVTLTGTPEVRIRE